MPEAPKIFLSASTPDLRSARQAACDALHAMGCQPVMAENCQADSGAFWHSLQPVLRECRAVVHLVGCAYGDEPERRQPAEHRRSYAQLEYDLAVSLRRPLSIIVCTDRFPFDVYPSEDAEKQRLQQTHRNFVQGGGRAFQFVENHAEMLSALFALRPPGLAPIVPVLPPPSAQAAAVAPAAPPFSPSIPPVARRRLFRWVVLGLMLFMLMFVVGAGVLGWMIWKREPAPAGTLHATPRAASPPRVVAAPPVRPSAPAPPNTTPAPSQEAASAPPPPPVVPESSVANVPGSVRADRSPVDAATRKAIVDRIALAPDIPADKKEKVREIVNRAHEMRRVLVLPFASGQSEVGASDAAMLRDLVSAPDFTPYREDPTCAFIVLGFADSRGADDYNLRLSTERARRVRDLLKQESGLHNVIHPVGLGKTTLLDEQNLEKNRIAEVWMIRL